MKILAPVGNFECLKAAIFNGADEVYLGVNEFNARNNIEGFTMDDLKQAVDYAHVFGVKVLLAINILFSDDELQTALNVVVNAFNFGVDAFIVQDIGLMALISENYPQVELHASTQMGLHNLEGVKEILKYGVKRVVLARETPLEEVKRIKDNLDIEIEYFVHGALCVSFSGNCYLSSYLNNASGNRGRCKQLCRLPYALLSGDKVIKKGYLLSAKDFNMLNRLNELKNAGVDVLKIEGRARRPYYVASCTRAYYSALRGLKVDSDSVKLAFNRNFTEGYFNGNGNIISDIQNHIGIKVGKVEKVNYGKNFNEIIIKSNRELFPKSTFKCFNAKTESVTLTAYDLKRINENKFKITSTQKVCVCDSVNLIVDAREESRILDEVPKRKLNISLTLTKNNPIIAKVNMLNEMISFVGDVCVPALKQPISKQELEINFNKSEYFSVTLNFENFDNVFMPKQKLNEFRRKVLDGVYSFLTKNNREKLEIVNINKFKFNKLERFNDFEIVENVEQVPHFKNVIYSPEIYNLQQIELLNFNLKKQGKKLYLDTPNFALKADIDFLKNIIDKTGVGIVVNNYYALQFDTEKVIGWGLNVYNHVALSQLNAKAVTAESELIERVKAPYMTLRHCPIKSHVGGDCDSCKYKSDMAYKMDSGKILKIKRKKLSTCTFYLAD